MIQTVLAERFLGICRTLARLGGQWKQASARFLANVAANALALKDATALGFDFQRIQTAHESTHAFQVVGALGVVVAFVFDSSAKKDAVQVKRTLAGLDHLFHGESNADRSIAAGRAL